VIVRPALAQDARRVAELHVTRITTGFLARLGPRFLHLLYRRAATSPHAFVLVAEDHDHVAGFVAGAAHVGRFYRSFLLRDGLAAAVVAAPRLARSPRKVVETLRYPATTSELPDAEILATAVDAPFARRGIGRCLVEAGVGEFARRGISAAKVVAGRDNTAALRLYERCGFAASAAIAVHSGTPSQVLVWHSS
jgi:ribosomal protein S18 acetylase RimI-like enzyme